MAVVGARHASPLQKQHYVGREVLFEFKRLAGDKPLCDEAGDPDPFFRPRKYQKAKDEVIPLVRDVIASLKDFRIEEYRENQGLFRVTRSVLFPPSAQDINVYVVQGLEGTTGLEITSVSRGAKRDWGQNKRNLREILSALDSKITPI